MHSMQRYKSASPSPSSQDLLKSRLASSVSIDKMMSISRLRDAPRCEMDIRDFMIIQLKSFMAVWLISNHLLVAPYLSSTLARFFT